MNTFLITKNEPEFLDGNYIFLNEGWASISDIGKSYNGKIFSADDYLSTENKFLKIIKLLLEHFKITTLSVMCLEKYIDNLESEYMIGGIKKEYNEIFVSIAEGKSYDLKSIEIICRLNLRERIWCMLYSREQHFVIKFGYDFFMYVICEDIPDKIKQYISKNQLYILAD